MGLQDYFSCSLAAGEVNSYKPEVGIFQHALELLGSQPAHTLYVGITTMPMSSARVPLVWSQC